MGQDLGATFGPLKLDLSGLSRTKIWADAASCKVSMHGMPYGGSTFPDVFIPEEGRRFPGGRRARVWQQRGAPSGRADTPTEETSVARAVTTDDHGHERGPTERSITPVVAIVVAGVVLLAGIIAGAVVLSSHGSSRTQPPVPVVRTTVKRPATTSTRRRRLR